MDLRHSAFLFSWGYWLHILVEFENNWNTYNDTMPTFYGEATALKVRVRILNFVAEFRYDLSFLLLRQHLQILPVGMATSAMTKVEKRQQE